MIDFAQLVTGATTIGTTEDRKGRPGRLESCCGEPPAPLAAITVDIDQTNSLGDASTSPSPEA